jgi:hypothetical protein
MKDFIEPITPIKTQEDKDFMREMIFGEFTIIPEYIQSKNISSDVETYVLKDENELEAVLEINFNSMMYKITLDNYVEEKEYIILDNLL